VKERLVKREANPRKICNYIKKSFTTSNREDQKRAKKIVAKMEDPIQKLMNVIKQ
jgi:hypothetical protein